MSINIHYSAPTFAVFSFIGLLLQLPIFLAYTVTANPNIPVATMAAWFFYLNLRGFITAVSWTSSDPTCWWSGVGWCDIDVHLWSAASVGILSSQLATNINLLKMFLLRTRRKTHREQIVQNILDAVICLVWPIVIIAVVSFLTPNRYDLVQYLGCLNTFVLTVPMFILLLLPLPILATSTFCLTIVTLILVWRRGKKATLETISYIPQMKPGYFVRFTTFSAIIAVVEAPLALYMFIASMIQLRKITGGFAAIPWSHGKPEKWDTVYAVSASEATEQLGISYNFIAMVVLLILSYFMFLCYGTGSAAVQGYKKFYVWSGAPWVISRMQGHGKPNKEEHDMSQLDKDDVYSPTSLQTYTFRSSEPRTPVTPSGGDFKLAKMPPVSIIGQQYLGWYRKS